MDTNYFFKTNIDKILSAFGKTNEDVKRDIETIKTWLEAQKHLPELPNEIMIRHFLVNNHFSIERTKQTLDMYYSVRTIIPEVFQNTNPTSLNMKDVYDSVAFSPLPNLTPKLQRIICARYNPIPENFNSDKGVAIMAQIYEVRLWEDLSLGDIFILDYQHLKMGHLTKVTPKMLREIAFIFEEVWSKRIQEFHVINAPSIADPIVSLFKKFLYKGLKEKVYLHKSLEELHLHVPQSILPVEYGGNEQSLDTLYELWKVKLQQYKSRFDLLDKLFVNEELRTCPYKNCDVLGYYGNYMKLDVS
ncbi:alpha-tocopherol transfer protein-like isoform X1 [Diabrotica virgifera virgifera]|uniref:CRAL-TRIO domain-containing protein n=1 Tax=Diabrotica virgifera virgifera TaxID=50390 RepID=A0ABM5KPF5_DIAVI|nr:alpha-tocopherol transfer protein-like isoform X1 [Diabrotica virgifera virgifera]